MFGTYFLHFGIILFPIFLYQVVTSKRPFVRLPALTPVMGIYGGLSAIYCEPNPIHSFSLLADLQCIPLILSFLYGKRRAGFISLAVAIGFRVIMAHSLDRTVLAILCMGLYSVWPCLVCVRYDSYGLARRLWTAVLASVAAAVVELAVDFTYVTAKQPAQVDYQQSLYVIVLLLLQMGLMLFATLVLDNIIAGGRLRASLVASKTALEASEQRYRSLVDYNPIGLCAIDTLGRISEVNRAFEDMTGYQTGELLGTDFWGLWNPTDEVSVRELFETNYNRQGNPDNLECQICHRSGQGIYVHLVGVPIFVEKTLAGHYAMINDITHRKMTDELIRKSEVLSTVRHLSAGVAHEIRTPLTSLKGFLQLIEQERPGFEQYFSIMQCELERIEKFTGELLVLAEPQSESYHAVNLNVIVTQVCDFMAPQAWNHHVDLAMRLGDIAYVWGDENQLKQVFVHLIRNAMDALPEGGHIDVRTSGISDAEILVSICDNGIGISEELLQHLGEPFFTSNGFGTGLGLMVSHRIIERHGGRIDYNSSPGLGTTVTVRLLRESEWLRQAGELSV